ncbi:MULTISPECIES: sugar ABC transporter ATP-binding protein [Halanaerobium]|jgi:ribose transport system ATP-binding protein|uniref:Monosaccharide ABC transporter ATP-binding protein (CUT2 family) n=1 Tax=Halanaerobium congolense TaxID=54121 RepID=A0A1G8NAV8_9FIRM|nr:MULTISPECIES: sugar ABC transporter ATP-binding protein [Halanaerobium]KXS49840.1 MAG: ribose transport system ATP-binding protein [Halanaerobium sp. T82-1]PUU92561.1 MAG: ribose transport system ATP-binding protein [Halanaerobium sp.]TDX40321.1 monosaccharide ABC transporter ATP-binding protein (CUT2 family) [Halanaerobium congolense]SDI76670.1 monosaccharide ABC transporter ATP-binding protein, CUT2 family [Halanaerobium congolense]SDK99571.1 monosaccharide ABC transporter ATP-binding pro
MDNEILRLEGLSKHFPGVKALDNISFDLIEGEIHALIGENGAGKSTLIKVLTGAYQKTDGKIFYRGTEVKNLSPTKSKNLGISAIYQELTLFPELTVSQNIFMGNERVYNKSNLVNDKEMTDEVRKIFKKIKLNISPDTLIKNLSIAQQQMIEIARAISLDADILIMDEPTSSISNKETEILFEIIEDLKNQGVTIIYISHRLEEIFEIANRVTVLRNGKNIKTLEINEIKDKDQLVNLMVGKEVTDLFPKKEVEIGETILEVKNLSYQDKFKNISFNLKKGEILGVGGLVGSQRTEVMETLFGLRKFDDGEIILKGNSVKISNAQNAIDFGLGLISEDRKATGIIKTMSVKENITLPGLDLIDRKFNVLIDNKAEEIATKSLVERLQVKTPSLKQKIDKLSGGNQQKAIIARWILLAPEILIMDEPTRGIDVGAKSEIYELMGELAKKGISIIMISSENPELLAMSDRIMVMREGEISGFLEGEKQTEENILKLAFGGVVN